MRARTLFSRFVLLLPVGIALACSSSKAPVRAAIDASALEALERNAAALDSDALVVLHDGAPVRERWFHGEPRAIGAQSVTKSVVSLAIGRLLTTGALASLDLPASTFFPSWKEDGRKAITLRHLLTMTSGLQVLPLANLLSMVVERSRTRWRRTSASTTAPSSSNSLAPSPPRPDRRAPVVLDYFPSTKSMPSNSSAICFRERWPILSSSTDLSSVTI